MRVQILLFFMSCSWCLSLLAAEPPIFKISIYSYPQTLEPQKQTSSVSYLFQNIFRNLFIYEGKGHLKPDMAKSCVRKNKGLLLQCQLRKDLRWSNGEKITAQDFIDTYLRILDPLSKAQRPDFLFPIKNAKAIFEGQKKPQDLGVKVTSSGKLQFNLNENDEEFEYNLSTFYLSPMKGSYDFKTMGTFLTNGPYKIKSWKPAESISVTSDSVYPGPASRPDIDFLAIEEDSVALRLYDKKELHFVRRLPTLLISKYQDRKDFFSLPVLRFDYLAFGPELKDLPEIRKALSGSLDFKEWQTLLASVGRPGCPGFPVEWTEPQRPCLQKEAFMKPTIKKNWVYYYSLQGGDDHRRTADWLQAQWKKNLGLDFKVRGVENKTYVSELKKNPPSVFRKGLSPDRPTCTSIMENFTQRHPENYIQNNNSEFDQIVQQMRQTSQINKKNKLCRKALDILMDDAKMIPTGPYHISLLASPEFTGWHLNELNQLDLNKLKFNVLKE